MMEFETLKELMASRTSHRKYRPDPIPREIIDQLIDCARHAPSGHNLQPWRFLALTDPERIQALAEVVDAQYRRNIADVPEVERQSYETYRFYVTHFKEAPLLFVVLGTTSEYLTTRLTTAYDVELPPTAHYDMDLLGIGAAVQNLLLAAHALGLGACWMTAPIAHAQAQIEAQLPIPEGYHAVSLVPVGKPTKKRQGPSRKSVDELLTILD
jgi:nitroreductase